MTKTPAEEALEAVDAANDNVQAAEYELVYAITMARAARVTWAEIGRIFGVSRQSAQSTWGKVVDEEMDNLVHDVINGTR